MSCEIGEKVDDDNDDDDDNEEVEEVEECSSVDGVGSSCASSEGVTTIDGGRFVPPASAGVDGEKVDDDNDDDDDNEEVEEVEECSSVDGVGSSCASSEGVTTIDGGRFVPPASAGVDGSLLPVLLPLSLAVCLLSDLAVGRRCRPRCLRRRPREVSWIANNLGGGGDGGGGGGNTEGGRSPKLPPKGPDEVRLEAREMPKLGEQRLPPTPEWGAKFSKLGGLGAEDVNVNNVSRVKIHAATERREGKGSESGGSGVE
ncbi:uncharacterized protein LOC142913926 isoform X1 [Petromyzon marinus]